MKIGQSQVQVPQQDDQDQQSQLSVWARAWQWVQKRWLHILAALVVAIMVGVVLYQSFKPASQANYQESVIAAVPMGQDSIMVSIRYPIRLRLEPSGEPRLVAVEMWWATPTSTPTLSPSPSLVVTGTVNAPLVSPSLAPTSTLTPSAVQATPSNAPAASTAPAPTATLTLGPTTGEAANTPSPTPTPKPWVLAFRSNNPGVAFADLTGVPAAPWIMLTPGIEAPALAILYVQQAPRAQPTGEAHISLSLYNPEGVLVSIPVPTLAIGLESAARANWRHLKDLVCGPTTFLITLAGALAAFGVQEWRRRVDLQREQQEAEKKATEERQSREREEKRRRVQARIEHLGLLEGQTEKAVACYRDLQQQAREDPDWKKDEDDSKLELAFLKTVPTPDLIRQAVAWFGNGEESDLRYCCSLLTARDDSDKIEQAFELMLDYISRSRLIPPVFPPPELARRAIAALKQIQGVCDPKGSEQVDRLLVEIVNLAKQERAKLGAEQEQGEAWVEVGKEALAYRQESLRWLHLWPAGTIPDPSEIARPIDRLGLKFNPFSPAVAELDARLPEYGLLSVFERVRGPRPAVVSGAAGSGKTAALLLMAWECLNPLESPRVPNTLPVRYLLFAGEQPRRDQRQHLAGAARAMASTVARFVTYQGARYLEAPAAHQQSIARLLSVWAGSPTELEARLQQAGRRHGTSPRLVQEIKALYQSVSPPDTSVDEYLDLLAGGVPQQCCVYLLVDIPARRARTDMRLMADSLWPLVDLAAPLAARGIYLKLFLADDLAHCLDDLSGCERLSLTWTDRDLKQLLADRLGRASKYGLRELDLLWSQRNLDLSERLVRAANGSPRRLLELGNNLLCRQVRLRGDGPLDEAWALRFLRSGGKEDA